MKQSFILLLMLLSVSLISCLDEGGSGSGGENAQSERMMASSPDMAKMAITEDMSGNENTGQEIVETRKLIKDARLAFETKDMQATRKKVSEILLKYNAYLDNENEFATENELSNSMTIRVQYDLFEKFVDDLLANEEKIVEKSISVRDITAEFLDVEARLRTQKELENRYRELLAKGNSVTELLEVERALANVRAQIESMESRMKHMSNQVALSTVHLRYFKKLESKSFSFGEQVLKGFVNGWLAIQWFIIGIINLWAFLLIGAIVFFIIYRAVKKSKKTINKNI
jgi:hypothetical protein